MNIGLIIFDVLVLPITFIRLCLIYLYGSRYNINGFEFLDVMTHAKNPYFNQLENDNEIYEQNDIRYVINKSSVIENIGEPVIKVSEQIKVEEPKNDEKMINLINLLLEPQHETETKVNNIMTDDVRNILDELDTE